MYLIYLGRILALALSFLVAPAHARTVVASWYGLHDHSAPRTSDGTRFSAYDPTICAALLWPPGTHLRLVNTRNGNVADCVVHDRGPFKKGRGLDVTYALKQILGMGDLGVIEVQVVR